ncbi:MAG: hypothetical protein CVV61_03540 [Tenericutes bacterium HGW-Tenericutes-6]|nr:MAG: hypothetical protein CVV61_03540 [Tenericutes bacterium HGW-Tenericutes-6]
MRLSDIQKLAKEPHSLPVIKDYLNQPLSQTDYQAAFSIYFEIAINHELYQLVYDEGIILAKELEIQQDTPYTEKIYKHLMTAALYLNHMDEAKSFMDLRKEKLPVMKQYLYHLDVIAYKKALSLPYLEDILRILKDVIPDDVKIFCHQELFLIYLKDQHDEMALKSLYELYNYDLKKEYLFDELKLLMRLGRIDEAIEKSLAELKLKTDMRVILILLEAYIIKGDYHKASTLETENESSIDSFDDEDRKKAYELLVSLYQKMDNKPSVEYYTRKLKSISKQESKKVKKEEVKDDKEQVVYVEKVHDEKPKHKHIAKQLDDIYELILYAHLIDEKLSLRDYFRTFFMYLDSFIKVKEHIIYLKNQTSNLFFYKKERLYDKTILHQTLEDTIFSHILKTGQDISEETKTLRFDHNILTGKTYDEEVKFIYGFPLGDIGVYVVHFEENIDDPGTFYDFLKLISALIFAEVMDESRLSKLKIENRFLSQALEAPILKTRLLTESRSTYNEEAQKLFNIDTHYHIELFLRDVSYEHVHLYKETIQKLLNKQGLTFDLYYRYQEKHILEKLYSLKIGEDMCVMSVFYDETENVEKTKELVEKATVDPDTGLANLYQFSIDFPSHIEDKSTMILIEMNQDLKHIYGLDQMNKYFKEFSQNTKKYFNEGITYRYDLHQVLVVLPYNDIRRVTKIVKDYLRYLEVYESKILKYEKFDVEMGILRYPVVTIEKSQEKIMTFLDISLEKAKRNQEEKYEFFVFKDYEDELFEQQVIDYLNQAIETKSLGVIFNQITDISKNRVWQYESELTLLNLSIDNKYLLRIAKKRNRLVDLERYHIEAICEYLVHLEKETERLIKLTIPISKETFLDPTFNPYLLGLLKKYAIPYDFIRLKCDMELRSGQFAAQIQELIDHGIALDSTSLDMALSYPFHALHIDVKKITPKWQAYVTHLKTLLDQFQMALVVRNVKTKDQKELLEQLGVQYIEGPIYKELPAPTLLQKIKESL